MKRYHVKYGQEKTHDPHIGGNTLVYKEYFDFYIDDIDGKLKPTTYKGPEFDISASKYHRHIKAFELKNVFSVMIGDCVIGEGSGVRYLNFDNIKKREWKKAKRIIKKFNIHNIEKCIEKIKSLKTKKYNFKPQHLK